MPSVCCHGKLVCRLYFCSGVAVVGFPVFLFFFGAFLLSEIHRSFFAMRHAMRRDLRWTRAMQLREIPFTEKVLLIWVRHHDIRAVWYNLYKFIGNFEPLYNFAVEKVKILR